MHKEWKFKVEGIKGVGRNQRLTGEPATAVGNLIVNSIINMNLVADNKN